MNPADLPDATARALDLLTASDPARSDPRLHRDARLLEEARLTRECAAEVWLAVSPLHVAPADVLHAVMARIDPPVVSAGEGKHRFLPWLAASGWAAAALVTFLLWPSSKGIPSRPGAGFLPASSVSEEELVISPLAPEAAPPSREIRLRNEILRLKNRLAEIRKDNTANSPRVLSLSSPGAAPRSEQEARRRVQVILTEALRSALEAESGAPGDPASLVIERGWPSGGLPVPSGDGVIRHRNFPEQSWQELGLLRSPEGAYLDSLGETVWTPDPENRGFIGKKTSPEQDLSRFEAAPDTPSLPPVAPRVLPEGFVIENKEENTAEVVIDQVPAPAEGNGQFIVWTDASGHESTVPLAECSTPLVGMGSFGVTGSGLPLTSVAFSIPGNGVLSFELVERSLIPNGLPERVIVTSGP